jgi:hypothetical protein
MEEYTKSISIKQSGKRPPAHGLPDELTANAVARMTVNNNFMLG